MKRLIVLGTGTGVGKTWVTAALARSLAALDPNLGVLPLKPVESGCAPADGSGGDTGPQALSDAELLARAARALETPKVARYAFREPLSPHLAAAREGVAIDVGEIETWVEGWEARAYGGSSQRLSGPVRSGRPAPPALHSNAHVVALHDMTSVALSSASSCESTPGLRTGALTLIETAGGVFSPLALGSAATATSPPGPPVTNFDLACAFVEARWVLVAPDALGVLHDVTATLLAMRARGRLPDWLVLSASRVPDSSTGTNANELRRLGIADPLAVFGRDSCDAAARLARAVLG